MEMTFDQKANNLVNSFYEFSQTTNLSHNKTIIFNINYDIRETLDGVEADMRSRLRDLQVSKNLKPTLKIPIQDIIAYSLESFFNSEYDFKELINEYIIVREHRKKVTNQPVNSHISPQHKILVKEICLKIKLYLRENKLSMHKICMRFFIDFVISKFIQDYYI